MPLPRLTIGPLKLSHAVGEIALGQPNPGIGGTEFTSLQLALRLAAAKISQTTVWLVEDSNQESISRMKSVNIVRIPSFSEFHPKSDEVVLAPAWNLLRVPKQNLARHRIVLWSRHPHDGYIRPATEIHSVATIVSVGDYAFWSNNWVRIPHVRIRNPVSPRFVSDKDRKADKQGPTVGHISSLHPSKGFHYIAKAWNEITREVPKIRLEVIGGISMYGDADLHPLLPVERRYGDKILKYFGGSVPDNVTFQGVSQNVDAKTASWAAAILNPTGLTEADPASLKDCLRLGIPAVGGFDYGMVDYLRCIPEVQLKSVSNLPRVVKNLLCRERIYDSAHSKSQKLASQILKIDATIEEAWKAVIDYVSEPTGTKNLSDLAIAHPPVPPPSVAARLAYRRMTMN